MNDDSWWRKLRINTNSDLYLILIWKNCHMTQQFYKIYAVTLRIGSFFCRAKYKNVKKLTNE